jgi:peptidyl-prolyl cis-trans isomerase A (cyclophilin A)
MLQARFTTSEGNFTIRLFDEEAPATVANFVGLATGTKAWTDPKTHQQVTRPFYDGLGFHRVVPGFVAQGGDPRGDGTGSAGHLVPCEPNALPYREGTVGMALSGLDTGSSQFFITLAPAPHLEGRYTAFGEVIEGMAVARDLAPGDAITRATIE